MRLAAWRPEFERRISGAILGSNKDYLLGGPLAEVPFLHCVMVTANRKALEFEPAGLPDVVS